VSGDGLACGRAETGIAYPKRHRDGVQHEDEQKLEEVRRVWRKAGHPVRAAYSPSASPAVQCGRQHGTNIVPTTIVGTIRSGMRSNSRRESSHAAGLCGRQLTALACVRVRADL
jgi:hypothetical protein